MDNSIKVGHNQHLFKTTNSDISNGKLKNEVYFSILLPLFLILFLIHDIHPKLKKTEYSFNFFQNKLLLVHDEVDIFENFKKCIG